MAGVADRREIPDPRMMKKWLDKRKRISLMKYPRSLTIYWGENDTYWTWEYFQEPSGEYFEIAKVKQVCWFEVEGKVNISELSHEVDYEAAFVVKLSDWAHGWETPLRLRLTLPNGKELERLVPLLEEPRRQWIELAIGQFQIEKNETDRGDVACNIKSSTGYWKQGLTLKGLIIRPKK